MQKAEERANLCAVARIHACAEPGCPELADPGRSRCPQHDSPRKAWAHRGAESTDNEARAAYARWRRRAIKQQDACQICGRRNMLDVHHLEDGRPMVLCNEHHRMLDPHARAR